MVPVVGGGASSVATGGVTVTGGCVTTPPSVLPGTGGGNAAGDPEPQATPPRTTGRSQGERHQPRISSSLEDQAQTGLRSPTARRDRGARAVMARPARPRT